MDLEEQYDKIYRYCYFRVRSRELAEDITQETFLRFLERGRSDAFRSNSAIIQDTGNALRYLYTIARNLCIDNYRRHCPELMPPEIMEAVEAAESETIYDRLISQIAVRGALAKLSEEERELLLLRYVNEVPAGVICSLLGISRFAVYRKTASALKHLKEKLGAAPGDL